jgi:hypothetical protein
MSFELILPFFPDELRELLLDPSISDLMINGTSGVFADRNGVIEQIGLTHRSSQATEMPAPGLAFRRAEVLPSTRWMPTAAIWSDTCDF